MAAKNKGEPQTHLSKDEIIQYAQKICDLYASQNATIASCCKAVGIDDRAFRYWVVKHPEVSQLYKEAKQMQEKIFFDLLMPDATKKALLRLIKGDKYTQVKRERGVGPNGDIDKTTETEMVVMPNPTAVIFASKAAWPNTFQDKQDITSGGKPINDFSSLPLEKRLAILKILNDGKEAQGEESEGQ